MTQKCCLNESMNICCFPQKGKHISQVEIYVNQDLMLVIKRSRSRPGYIASASKGQMLICFISRLFSCFFLGVSVLV